MGSLKIKITAETHLQKRDAEKFVNNNYLKM